MSSPPLTREQRARAAAEAVAQVVATLRTRRRTAEDGPESLPPVRSWD